MSPRGPRLAFHTLPRDRPGGFAPTRISDPRRRPGRRSSVDDTTNLAEPMFQDGVVAQAVDQVKARGVSYFSAAGNYRSQASYEAPFPPEWPVSVDIGLGPAGGPRLRSRAPASIPAWKATCPHMGTIMRARAAVGPALLRLHSGPPWLSERPRCRYSTNAACDTVVDR